MGEENNDYTWGARGYGAKREKRTSSIPEKTFGGFFLWIDVVRKGGGGG